MSRPLRVAFLWHMHQPYYLDDPTSVMHLPWVRLHATKAYHDMNAMLRRHPEMACTINVVPSLAAQLAAYRDNAGLTDVFLDLSRRDPADLNEDERRFVLRFFFMCNWETMIRPHPGYARLLDNRGAAVTDANIDRAMKLFTNQDVFDLQVWFNLAWMGFTARRDPRIAALLEKDMGFNRADKQAVLDVQAEIVGQVLAEWKELAGGENVELSTSPFYHPILPILVGAPVVRRSMPGVALSGDFAFPEDAREQIRRGVEYFRKTFGRAPAGMWPSEGSVCPELVPYWQEAGLKWVATDEGILFRSLGGQAPRQLLYQPYRATYADAEVAVFFRDRALSDLIGFTYAKNETGAAVRDFIGHLAHVGEAAPGGVVSVVLDGENPWEYYPDGGESFLDGLYTQLVKDSRFTPTSMGRALAETPPTQSLSNLHSGSWINSNYGIWIGKPEENKGWALVDRTRSHLVSVQQSGRASQEKIAAAYEQLYQAEGSDWFWWFDDDFNSDNDADFDRLFRQKLANVHRALGENPPAYLSEAIHVDRDNLLVTMPLSLLHPTIDGRVTHFYEWSEAGELDLSRARGSMHLSKNLLDTLLFGFDADRFYLRLDPNAQLRQLGEGSLVRIHIQTAREWRVEFPLRFGPAATRRFQLLAPAEGDAWRAVGEDGDVGVGETIEVAMPLAAIEAKAGQSLSFVVHIILGEVEEDRFPKNGRVTLVVPDEHFDSINWSV